MNNLIILDNNSEKYIVKNPVVFFNHLIKFHCDNNQANGSLHEENGHYFTVTPKLLEQVKDFIKWNKTKN